jgi:beta-glucosidase-like glycosyl hydrolase
LSPLLRAARKQWGFEENGGYVTSDTDAVNNAWHDHHYVETAAEASCLAITAGGDQINSGNTFSNSLLDGVKQGHCSMADVDAALTVAFTMRFDLGEYCLLSIVSSPLCPHLTAPQLSSPPFLSASPCPTC